MKNSRTYYVKRNIWYGGINKTVTLLLPFLTRTILIQKLGAEYLGLGSLFSSILQVLNMTELGFSSAVTFKLYKPVAEHDTQKVCALMALYRNIYKAVGIGILVIGLMLMPFLPYLIHGSYPKDINIYGLYFIYLLNTSISYLLFAYKNVLLSVDQRQDILSNLDTVLITLKSIIQIAVLAAVQNYALYIIWNLFYSVAYNLAVACITKKKYPEYICRGKLSGNELRAIFIQIKGLAVGKISQVSRTSFDNIILSAFCGLTDVAVYGNYYYILSAVLGFLTIIIQAMTASVGNSVATESKDKNYADFMRFNFYFNWLGSWCAICLLCLYQPFMRLWAGEKLTAPFYSAVLFSIFFYISQTGQIRSVYTSASGIWWEFRYLAVGEMICNIVLNFGLGYIFGMNGIVTATILTVTLFSIIGVGKKTINIYFKRGCAPYFRAMGAYALVTAAAGFVTYKACAEIKADGVSAVILRMLACIILPNVILSAAAVSNKKTRSYLKQIRSILFVEQ